MTALMSVSQLARLLLSFTIKLRGIKHIVLDHIYTVYKLYSGLRPPRTLRPVTQYDFGYSQGRVHLRDGLLLHRLLGNGWAPSSRLRGVSALSRSVWPLLTRSCDHEQGPRRAAERKASSSSHEATSFKAAHACGERAWRRTRASRRSGWTAFPFYAAWLQASTPLQSQAALSPPAQPCGPWASWLLTSFGAGFLRKWAEHLLIRCALAFGLEFVTGKLRPWHAHHVIVIAGFAFRIRGTCVDFFGGVLCFREAWLQICQAAKKLWDVDCGLKFGFTASWPMA